MGSVQPSREHLADIAFGWPLLQQVVELGIGSAMVVRERDVIAVEATEQIRVAPMSLTDALAATTDGRIIDAKTIAALHVYHHNRREAS